MTFIRQAGRIGMISFTLHHCPENGSMSSQWEQGVCGMLWNIRCGITNSCRWWDSGWLEIKNPAPLNMHVPHNNNTQLLAMWTNFRQDYEASIKEVGRTAPCPKIGCTHIKSRGKLKPLGSHGHEFRPLTGCVYNTLTSVFLYIVILTEASWE